MGTPANTTKKADFDAAVATILASSKANADNLSTLVATGLYDDRIRVLLEHDPELARLVKEADTAAIEPLNRIVRYLSRRCDN